MFTPRVSAGGCAAFMLDPAPRVLAADGASDDVAESPARGMAGVSPGVVIVAVVCSGSQSRFRGDRAGRRGHCARSWADTERRRHEGSRQSRTSLISHKLLLVLNAYKSNQVSDSSRAGPPRPAQRASHRPRRPPKAERHSDPRSHTSPGVSLPCCRRPPAGACVVRRSLSVTVTGSERLPDDTQALGRPARPTLELNRARYTWCGEPGPGPRPRPCASQPSLSPRTNGTAATSR